MTQKQLDKTVRRAANTMVKALKRAKEDFASEYDEDAEKINDFIDDNKLYCMDFWEDILGSVCIVLDKKRLEKAIRQLEKMRAKK